MKIPAMMSLLLVSVGLRDGLQVINSSRPAQGPARIYLRALGKRSTYNCEYIKEKKCRSGPCWLDSSAPGFISTSCSGLLLLWFLVLMTLPENTGLL
ncbi:GPI-linked NAD(P)(+)--arginine ADP-ribosyltransferase 1 isoform X2 [Peromyscus californicus insignis]|uniref:GPI-linked NAD(P)(+)--arginine ADP-ribosyltransferase 1 isoform X2 n=1 Tax=Peromyscus californicus insignis TaxID=564181 RepID=UPI0022A70BB2|nr:GPI-linked NAD(P)(+)--arginine ADP-ribosyltransferase 1 isoform X2 [Peromyscus californicus insignis]